MRTNGFDDDEGYANLYELLSRVNHACGDAANSTRISLKSIAGSGAADNSVVVVAERDIEEGEELLVNYLDSADEGMGVEERRRHLLRTHNFTCTCAKCMAELGNK